MISRDTSKQSADIVMQIYRNMSASKKARLLFNTMQMGQKLAMAGLRQRYPDADERRIWHLWAKQHLGEKLYQQVYEDKDE